MSHNRQLALWHLGHQYTVKACSLNGGTILLMPKQSQEKMRYAQGPGL